jgi:hypothetical protein
MEGLTSAPRQHHPRARASASSNHVLPPELVIVVTPVRSAPVVPFLRRPGIQRLVWLAVTLQVAVLVLNSVLLQLELPSAQQQNNVVDLPSQQQQQQQRYEQHGIKRRALRNVETNNNIGEKDRRRRLSFMQRVVAELEASPKSVTLKHREEELKPQEGEPPASPSTYISTSTSNSCAINLFGLPRAFESLVLPSLKTNVIPQNIHCDYFVHYYNQTTEAKGRDNNGGDIDPLAILKLRDAVHEEFEAQRQNMVPNVSQHLHLPKVEFVTETPEDFDEAYAALLTKIHNTKDPSGDQSLYFPWAEGTYVASSLDNIIKMWHSIQSAWHLMERSRSSASASASASANTDDNKKNYDTVAVLRNDVVYLSPIHVHADPFGDGDGDGDGDTVTIPGFDKWPVSDRAIYGPYEAVKVWSTRRFDLLDQHVQDMYDDPRTRGYGMHSERFLSQTLFPAMTQDFNRVKTNTAADDGQEQHAQQRSLQIKESPTMCFLRARAGEEVVISDCSVGIVHGISLPSILEQLPGRNPVVALEQAIGRSCHRIPLNRSWDQSKPWTQKMPCRTAPGTRNNNK